MTPDDQDTANTITVPPLIYLGFLMLGFVLDYFLPIAVLPGGLRYVAAAAIILLSVIVVVATLPRFRKAGTSFDVRRPTTSLITDGPFRYSRNPSYLSLSLLYVGIGVALDNVWIVGLLVPVLIVMHYGVILREERYLERKFGEEYRHYKMSVRRWI